MQTRIRAILRDIEEKERVRICYACEAGSRAWGFPSKDSDYDVRFIYIHPITWYLSIDRQRDVIERPISANLDINGWDLRKALQLFRKSNTPLLEWLGSPIVYWERSSLAAQMREMQDSYFSPPTCIHQYLSMAIRNRDYRQNDQVNLKKLFYVLRPLLAVKWIEQGLGVVPTEMMPLVEAIVSSSSLKADIIWLIEIKKHSREANKTPKIASVIQYVEEALSMVSNMHVPVAKPVEPTEELDVLFRNTLTEVWP